MTAPTTDAEYLAWLQADAQPRCLLVEMTYRPSGGGTSTVYLASAPFVSRPGDTPANQTYLAVITAVPQFRQSMSDVMLGRTTYNEGTITLHNGDGAFDDWLDYTTYNFFGRPLAMYLGASDWPRSAFRAVWTGVTAQVTMNGTNSVSITARDRQHLLNVEPTSTLISSGSFPNAGPNIGKRMPLCYGQCSNVQPVLLDSSAQNYAVHDGAVNAFTQMYERGVAGTPSYADTSTGRFNYSGGADPGGTLTYDMQGAKPGGSYLTKAKDIITDLLITRGPLTSGDMEATTWAAMNTTFPQAINLYVQNPAGVMLYELVDQIMRSVGGYYTVNRDGQFVFDQFKLSGSSTLSIGTQDIAAKGLAVARQYQPWDKLSRGYKKNWTVITNGNAGVTEDERERMAGDGYWKVSTNASAANYSKVYTPDKQMTLLTSATDCQTEADRWMGIWGVPRIVYSIQCFTGTARLNIGSRVTVTHPRYGLSAGVDGTVVAITDRPSKKMQTLEVMM